MVLAIIGVSVILAFPIFLGGTNLYSMWIVVLIDFSLSLTNISLSLSLKKKNNNKKIN